ncbi:thioredoxin family protein [Flavobacterium magnum]|uniref:Thioredoxin family protein n=1 Tax=Flavobacterium magnum TaxID=2162713 RepID=A0A2S0RFB8_9FLAO|nr:thioredoxin family protein [Flavobacterium magnum]AWA29412.1 thioredoxin family protein [Flavobacterium magnum]
MKLLAVYFLLLVLPTQWEPDFENAKKLARENHQLILLNFSGSDWCGPCMVTRKDYFDSDVFSAMAKSHLVMVNADFPRKKKNIPSADVVKRNEALADQYNKQGMFPFTLLLDADGKVIKTWSGKPGVSPEQFTAEVKAICDAHK